ncbi:MAG: TIGR02099 family protein [Gammaproteobacteria bacterium]|nr:TIGR02099 family protein [Gammaproteobacteria bacterium]
MKRILRRARTLLWTAFSIIVVGLAIGAGLGKLLMPYSVHYQPELEQWLSREFGQPVSIESFEGEWTAFGPRLTLKGLALLDPSDGADEAPAGMVIESAALDIRPLSHLLANRPLYNFRVIGADFELVRDKDGHFHLSGFGVSNREGDSAITQLVRVGEVVLEDSSLQFIDDVLGIRLGLSGINGRLNLDDDVLASKVQATLHDTRSGLDYGRLNATAVLSLSDERLQGAQWRLSARKLMLASFQGKVPSNPFLPLTGWLEAEAWGDWSDGGGHRINGTVDLQDALLVNDFQDMHVERAESRFRWRYASGGQWNLHLADFMLNRGDASWRSPRLSVARDLSNDVGLWISADQLPLGAPLNLTREIMSIYGHDWPENAPVEVDGQVRELDLVLSATWRLALARGQFSEADLAAWGSWPQLTGLSGSVELQDGSGEITLAGQNVGVDWPRMFGQPLAFELPTCRIEVSWIGRPSAGFERCGLSNDDLAVGGDLSLTANSGRPSIDANLAVERAELDRLDGYWPQGAMSERVVAWLRRGLRDGRLDFARAQIHGDLDNWPFREGKGRFEAVAWIDTPVIRYREDWPDVTGGSDVVARFQGPGMEVRGSIADTGGVPVEEVFAGISDFSRPLLKIEYQADSDLPGLLGFVRQTPLLDRAGVDLTPFEFSGQATVSGAIDVPLGRTPGRLGVDGLVLLDEAAFRAPDQQVDITAIRGEVGYDETGFLATDLEGRALEEPVRLDIAVNSQAEESFRAELRGVFDVRDLLVYGGVRPLLEEHLGGRSDWTIGLSAGRQPLTLDVQSSLEGVALDLPSPFYKPSAERLPFALSLPLGRDSDGPLRINLAQRGALAIDLAEEDGGVEAILLDLGSSRSAAPAQGAFRIQGTTPTLDLDGWIELALNQAGQGASMAELALEADDIRAGEVRFLDRLFSNVALGVEQDSGELTIAFESADIDGKVRYSGGEDAAGSLFAEFERLVLGAPDSDGMSMETDPKDLPVLHLYVSSFSYLGLELGETRIEAYPTPSGLHFEKVDATSDALSLQASGDWSLTQSGHRSDFRISMASESLGDFLNSMDISSSVLGGQTLVSFNAQWAGSPAGFALSRLNGEVEFSVVDGNITGASAGSGRLLGLVSFTALPKRLALDFRDVFESGFSFDQANGTFTLRDGVAFTNDLLLESSSASIAVSGETDLVDQRYDQVITIRPGVGNTLPIIGALAAGPGGAAAGLALQGLLHDSLAEATQVRYTITGSWDEPVIEPVDVERAGG